VKKKIHTHYDNLRISRTAPDEVIRAAYKALSQKYHPDKNQQPDASKIMAILNNSYAVLSDQKQRRKHDEWIAEQENTASVPRAAAPRRERTTQTERSKPSAHNDAPAQQPRRDVVPVWQTWNVDLSPRRMAIALCGIVTAVVLIFLMLHEKPISMSLPSPAEVSAADHSVAKRKAHVEIIIAGTAAVHTQETAEGPLQQAVAEPDGSAAGNVPRINILLGPDGKSWPLGPKIYRDEGLRDKGQSTITIDNSHNAHAVYVKLGIEPRFDQAVGELYIPRHRLMTLENLPAGIYHLKYRDLETGLTMQSQPVLLEEPHAEPPVQYGVLGITLYASPLDNVDFHQIDESAF
jgi:hypothetical protein